MAHLTIHSAKIGYVHQIHNEVSFEERHTNVGRSKEKTNHTCVKIPKLPLSQRRQATPFPIDGDKEVDNDGDLLVQKHKNPLWK